MPFENDLLNIRHQFVSKTENSIVKMTNFSFEMSTLNQKRQRYCASRNRGNYGRENFSGSTVSHLFKNAVFLLGVWTKLCAAICPSPCQCPSPSKVDCANKGLTQIPRGISSDIVDLDLSGNRISIQPGSFRYGNSMVCWKNCSP